MLFDYSEHKSNLINICFHNKSIDVAWAGLYFENRLRSWSEDGKETSKKAVAFYMWEILAAWSGVEGGGQVEKWREIKS